MHSKMIESSNKMGVFADFFVENLLEDKEQALTIGLSGDLGSGKTTFVQSVAKFFGIKNHVTSPTFVLQKKYPIDSKESDFKNLIHIDAYRLENSQDLLSLGWEEIKNNPENIIFIEWPEKVSEVLPKDIKMIKFKFIDENVREVFYEKGKDKK
jgi:tRNA threonylcarbamoyladenosine biosynthesis protein TsaE